MTGDAAEIHMDGGVRSGQDVLKRLSARGVHIGRAYIFGLRAMGQAGKGLRPHDGRSCTTWSSMSLSECYSTVLIPASLGIATQ